MEISRRYFFFGTCALAAGCARRAQPPKELHRVSIICASSYTAELVDPIRRLLLEHQVRVAGQRVLLKPNLVEFSPDAPINTHPVFVAAVANAFRALGAASVDIAEGPGHRRMTLDMADAVGYFQAVPNFERMFTDLNLDQVTRMGLRQPHSTLKELYLPNTVLRCDLLVSLPKLKTHHWAGATLAMKNLFGVVPGGVYGWPKNVLHWAGIHESIADLNSIFPKQFCLVDGIEAMEGNGPILGSRKASRVIVAGHHPPSVDATCCRLMGIDPEKIRYLTLVRRGTMPYANSVQQTGESLESVRQRFELLPHLRHLRLEA